MPINVVNNSCSKNDMKKVNYSYIYLTKVEQNLASYYITQSHCTLRVSFHVHPSPTRFFGNVDSTMLTLHSHWNLVGGWSTWKLTPTQPSHPPLPSTLDWSTILLYLSLLIINCFTCNLVVSCIYTYRSSLFLPSTILATWNFFTHTHTYSFNTHTHLYSFNIFDQAIVLCVEWSVV
jgi:hypothetical protein